jgi:catechol 2,3-dioxygenase-like lactoylglutathione lyase family enzyme
MSMSIACRAGLLACAVSLAAHAAEPLPIQRLIGASFQVQDLDKARHFYADILGYTDVSTSKDRVIYRLNDEQSLDFSAGAPENFRLLHLTMRVPDPDAFAAALERRRIVVKKENGYASVQDPERNEIHFVRALERQAAVKPGGFSDHLLHVGVNSDHETESMALYRDALGFREMARGGPSPEEIRWIILNMPSTPRDWVEVMIAKAQPPAARQHVCFEVPDIQRCYKQLTGHGLPANFKPFLAQNHRWIMNLKDPNGLRVEIMGEESK